MKGHALCELRVLAPLEAEDEISDLLGKIAGQPAFSFHQPGRRTVTVSAYRTPPFRWTVPLWRTWTQGLERLSSAGLDPGSGHVSIRKVPWQDWAESWRRHFPALEIGSALLIKPSWSRRNPRRDQALVVLDPGLSFGTGHHPTTGFCLSQIVAWGTRQPGASLWDVGTGTGILAIAAAKVGYDLIEAIDFDPKAVQVARANARANQVFDRLRIRRADLTKLPLRGQRRYHVVCANLEADLLLAESVRLRNRLRPDGLLILAGILRRQFAEICGHYERHGLKLVRSAARAEWRSGAFVFSKR